MRLRLRSGLREKPRGVTLLEMLVSTAMLAFIVLGLTAMFIQTQKAFKMGLRQTDTTDAGRAVAELIGSDLAQMSDGQPGYSTNPCVTNLFWMPYSINGFQNYQGGDAPFVQIQDGIPYRTNEQDAIFMLVRTNSAWMGIGYVVANVAPGLGTLYRYVTITNDPLGTNNALYFSFSNALVTFPTNFQTQFPTNWNRVADGVMELRLRTFDQNGNAVTNNNVNSSIAPFHFPLYGLGFPLAPSNNVAAPTLPMAAELELAMLDQETLKRAQALEVNPLAQSNFLASNSLGYTQIFRQQVQILSAKRQ